MRDVPDQQAEFAHLIEAGEFRVAESVFALERHHRLARHHVCEALLGLSTLPTIAMSGAARAVLRGYPDHPKIAFEDRLLAATAKDDRAEPLWTFDRQLVNQSDTSLVRQV